MDEMFYVAFFLFGDDDRSSFHVVSVSVFAQKRNERMKIIANSWTAVKYEI